MGISQKKEVINMYSAKIYYTKNYRCETEAVDNIQKWEVDENGGVTIVFGDPDEPRTIKRHRSDIEDIHIFRVNPALF